MELRDMLVREDQLITEAAKILNNLEHALTIDELDRVERLREEILRLQARIIVHPNYHATASRRYH
jgi:hypothetical protein